MVQNILELIEKPDEKNLPLEAPNLIGCQERERYSTAETPAVEINICQPHFVH